MSRGRCKGFVVFLLVAAVLATASCVPPLIPTPYVAEEFPICTNPHSQGEPAISGDIVVWADLRNGNMDIYGYNLSTDTEFPICTESADQRQPSISGDTIVWIDYRNGNWDIYGYNLATEEEFPICIDPHSQTSPAISGDIVVWRDERNDYTEGGFRYNNIDIYGYNLSTQTEFPVCTAPGNQMTPAISGDIVVWTDTRANSMDIYGYNLSTGTEFPICTKPDWQEEPAISGDIVVWGDWRNRGVYGYYLSTGTEFPIVANADSHPYPAISGDIVVWLDERLGYTTAWEGYKLSNIYGYNLATEEEFAICTNPVGQGAPVISGDIVVWYDDRNGNNDIYGARLSFEE